MTGRPLENIVGRRFGKLVVVEFLGYRWHSKNYASTWKCQCDCGSERIVKRPSLISGVIKSCGCLNGRIRHRGFGTPEYKIWSGMRQRCKYPRDPGFKNYGARGISVCERWDDFAAFLADMGQRPSADHSIDRINNEGNYEPSNCRWATAAEQNANTRANHLITFKGETLPLTHWARRTQLSRSTIFNRLKRGWPVSETLTRRPTLHLPKVKR